MPILRLEISNPQYTEKNTQLLTVYSSHLGRRQDITIYHNESEKKDLPIVILLHGVYGNHWVWMHLGGVHLVYEQLRQQGLSEFILVMPADGGFKEGSAYLPLQEQGNFEQWIVDDVIQATIQSVPSASTNSNVYISGLSMGGYGALRLGTKYPTLFSGISAHSAICQLSDLSHFVDYDLSVYQPEGQQPNETEISYWLNKNKAQLPPLRFDCGKDDVLFASNEQLYSKLKSADIDVSYEALDGEHSWEYWHQNVAKTLRFFNAIEIEKQN